MEEGEALLATRFCPRTSPACRMTVLVRRYFRKASRRSCPPLQFRVKENLKLELKTDMSHITPAGAVPFAYDILGAPLGDARIINWSNERHPEWHHHWRSEATGELAKSREAYGSAEDALKALQDEVGSSQ